MSYLNLRLYQRNTQCLHIRKHRLAGFFVRSPLSPVLLPHRHLCHLPTSILIRAFWRMIPRLWPIYRVLKMGKNYRQGRIASISI